MCGICGKLNFGRDKPVDQNLISRMGNLLKHRGPDDEGVFVKGNIGLGHRRLSVIDLSTGQQPMSNEPGSIWIVFNGEIYNFLDLREELRLKGHRFKTNSDTEVIIHLYEEYGTKCVSKLRGMFAFAIWDEGNQRLFLARDRIGKKPLFYSINKRSILFASEIKAILLDSSVGRSTNLEALHDYLSFLYIPSPKTAFSGIYKLPPAHILVCENGNIKRERYWDVRYTDKWQLSERAIQERLYELLIESVKLRLISDVPLGVFLSGGLDSSLIVAMMSKILDHPVKTFSIGIQDNKYNELPYARIVAKRFKTEHHEFIVKPDAVNILPKLIWHFDEPFGNPTALPTYYLSEMTREHVKVALNGDGGDELFAGYEKYAAHNLLKYYRLVPKMIRQRLVKKLFGLFPEGNSPKSLIRRMKSVTEDSFLPPDEAYAFGMSYFKNLMKKELYSPMMKKAGGGINSLDFLLQYYNSANADNPLDRMLYTDLMTYLPEDLLPKVDRPTMAHGLEGRSPLLDHVLVEFAARIPTKLKLNGITFAALKHIEKSVAQGLLPSQILHREKIGFIIPVGNWLRKDLRELSNDLLLSKQFEERGYFKMGVVRQMLEDHQTGKVDHTYRLWALLNLELWHLQYIDKNITIL